MGLFSRFSSTARKAAAAAALQAYYETCKRHGIFTGDPAKLANGIVSTACERLPELADGQCRPYLFAAASILVVTKEGRGTIDPNLFSMGLSAMLQAALSDPAFKATTAEESIIKTAASVLEEWNGQPSPWLNGFDGSLPDPGPITTAHPHGDMEAMRDPRKRELARAELVRRMQESDRKA